MKNRCPVSHGTYTCILPAGHTGIHLTDGAGVTADGRLYITGYRAQHGTLVRHYVK